MGSINSNIEDYLVDGEDSKGLAYSLNEGGIIVEGSLASKEELSDVPVVKSILSKHQP